jgi:nucleoside-diphosphate-sugar epimerase
MSMRVLIIGGTGLISIGIVSQLLARGAQVTLFNRGRRNNPHARWPAPIEEILGDRDHYEAFERRFASTRYDVVIHMVCYRPDQAESAVRAFAGRCQQMIFCSTVCTYGVKVPPGVLVDESWPQEPISAYGRGKLACEQLFRAADAAGAFRATVIRPSNTYGPGNALIDQLEPNAVAWDRIERGLPVLCAGDGLGLWQSTHRDDCGKLFAYSALNAKTFGESYNATIERVFTWRDYYREAARAIGRSALLVPMPAEWIVARDPSRFGLLAEITRFHGAYDSSKARRDVPEFRCEIGFERGAAETLTDLRRRGAWRSSADDALYQSMVDAALAAGVRPFEA